MGGRQKQSIFRYDFTGKFLKKYKSITELRTDVYPKDKGKRPVFLKSELGIEYELLEDSICFKKRIGRDTTKFVLEILNSKYCTKEVENEKAVEVFNLRGEKIAEVKSKKIAEYLFSEIPTAAIHRMLKKGDQKNRFNKYGLQFKFKKEEDVKE